MRRFKQKRDSILFGTKKGTIWICRTEVYWPHDAFIHPRGKTDDEDEWWIPSSEIDEDFVEIYPASKKGSKK